MNMYTETFCDVCEIVKLRRISGSIPRLRKSRMPIYQWRTGRHADTALLLPPPEFPPFPLLPPLPYSVGYTPLSFSPVI